MTDLTREQVEALAGYLDPDLLPQADAASALRSMLLPSEALAMVGAALEEAANMVRRAGHSLDDEIRALNPDATAALEAVKEAARREGMEWAAEHIEGRFEEAVKMHHNASEWDERPSYNGSKTLLEWVFDLAAIREGKE